MIRRAPPITLRIVKRKPALSPDGSVWTLSSLERLPLGLPYTEIVKRIARLERSVHPRYVMVDAGGPGRPVLPTHGIAKKTNRTAISSHAIILEASGSGAPTQRPGIAGASLRSMWKSWSSRGRPPTAGQPSRCQTTGSSSTVRS
jgi:hypothetical protein